MPRAPLVDFDAVAARIRAVPGVVSAMPVVEGQVGLTTERGGAYLGGLVRGVRQADLEKLYVVSDHILAGSLDAFQGDDAVAIGTGLAQRLGLGVGSRLELISPQGAATVVGNIPRIRAYKVVAIFQVGFNEADTGFVFLPIEAAQVFFRQPNAATQIEVITADPDHVQGVSRALRGELAGLPVRVIDWTQSNNSFFAAVEVERNVMFLILTLIILVAAFNIVSSLIMMVKDKTRDIAVLRTLGAGQGSIMRIFLLCGASVGVAGTLTGAAARDFVLPKHRDHPALAGGADGDQSVQSRGVFPLAPAGGGAMARGGAGNRHGAGAVAAGDAVSELAGGAHRPGGGVAQ